VNAVCAPRAWIGENCLLVRSRAISLLGEEFETPLLVPAISSKAVGPIQVSDGDRKFRLAPASEIHSQTMLGNIRDAVLISSYDIHFRYLAESERLVTDFESSIYSGPRVLWIDSGWYEKSVGPSSGQWYHEVGHAEPFERENYEEVIDSLPSDLRAVLVSWDTDDESKYDAQVEAAQEFFASRKTFASDLLLKPEGKRRYHDFSTLSRRDASRLNAFDVIGVTEKELGDSVKKRLEALVRLRLQLDEAKVDAPIHIFGGLDPLMTPLYFAAGAEIFDGLAWLRYAFRNGISYHLDSTVIIDRHYEKPLAQAVAQVHLRNLDEIDELARELRVFADQGESWDKLRQGRTLGPAGDALDAFIGRIHGR
jgi:hypothetical protein